MKSATMYVKGTADETPLELNVDTATLTWFSAVMAIPFDSLMNVTLATMLTGKPYSTSDGLLSVVPKHGNGTMPEWAERAFLARPTFWPDRRCAMVRRHPDGLLASDYGYLRHNDDGSFWHLGNICFEGAKGVALTPEQVQNLYNEGWRVD